MVRLIGLEPTRRKTPDPKSGASTNFATGAKSNAKVLYFFETEVYRGRIREEINKRCEIRWGRRSDALMLYVGLHFFYINPHESNINLPFFFKNWRIIECVTLD